MTTIPDWPFCSLTPLHVAIYPEYSTRPDQDATNGMRRSPGLTSGTFRLKLIDVTVEDEAGFRTLMAMLGLMEGNSNLVRLNVPDLYSLDGRFAKATRAQRALYPEGVPFASDVLFDDGVGFEYSYLTAEFTADAAIGAREIYIEAEGTVPGGVLISIDEFVYVVTGSWEEDGVQRLKISPTLRKAALTGDEVSLAPVFVGFCVTQNPGNEPRERWKRGTYTFEFVEDLTRLVDLS
jgi:hypothetical protein